jgi:HD-like signal output (HDOD) protein
VVITDRSVQTPPVLKSLPPFPAVAAKVAELLENDLTSFYDVAELLESDAALSAEVLRLANSPLIGIRYEITNVMQALAILGSRRIATLIMTLSVSKLAGRAANSDMMRRLWRHNLACALAARHLAELQHRDSIEAYYAGLFHEVGRLAMLSQHPEIYDQAVKAGDDIDEIEYRHFGLGHCEAGAWVIKEWKLPPAFIEVVLHHRNPAPDASHLTLIVNLACQIADRLGFSVVPVQDRAESEPTDEIGIAIALAVNSLTSEFGVCL